MDDTVPVLLRCHKTKHFISSSAEESRTLNLPCFVKVIVKSIENKLLIITEMKIISRFCLLFSCAIQGPLWIASELFK